MIKSTAEMKENTTNTAGERPAPSGSQGSPRISALRSLPRDQSPHLRVGGDSPQKRGSWKWLTPLTKKTMEKRTMSTSTAVSISASGLLQGMGMGSRTQGMKPCFPQSQ